jgi:epoxyqueuosine reductase
MTDAKRTVRTFLHAYKVDVVGFCSFPDAIQLLEIERRLPRAIVFGYRLSSPVLNTVTDRPSLLYKHHYKTVNWILDQTAFFCTQFIQNNNRNALAIPATQLVDWQHHKGHVSHRHLGQEAGLGHIGRSGLLIHPQYGAQVRYVSILTDLEFEPDTKIDTACGTCKKCVLACPAKAISDDGVDIERCYAKLSEFAGMRGIGQHICGICVKVCNGKN